MPSSITYTAVLDVSRTTAEHLARLLREQRERTGTRRGTRALGVFKQSILVLRWFIDGARLAQLARDNGISLSTTYRYLHEGITVLAEHAPGLSTALERATAAGYTHLNLDGTVIRTDRVAAPGPNGSDLWWSGKHTAPRRRPVVYPTQSGGIGGIFLGLMPNLAPKGQGNNSMVGNRCSCPGVWNEAPGDPRDMVNG